MHSDFMFCRAALCCCFSKLLRCEMSVRHRLLCHAIASDDAVCAAKSLGIGSCVLSTAAKQLLIHVNQATDDDVDMDMG